MGDRDKQINYNIGNAIADDRHRTVGTEKKRVTKNAL